MGCVGVWGGGWRRCEGEGNTWRVHRHVYCRLLVAEFGCARSQLLDNILRGAVLSSSRYRALKMSARALSGASWKGVHPVYSDKGMHIHIPHALTYSNAGPTKKEPQRRNVTNFPEILPCKYLATQKSSEIFWSMCNSFNLCDQK